eukprot:1158169-Pelagomonas_calceolata.AAC.8
MACLPVCLSDMPVATSLAHGLPACLPVCHACLMPVVMVPDGQDSADRPMPLLPACMHVQGTSGLASYQAARKQAAARQAAAAGAQKEK